MPIQSPKTVHQDQDLIYLIKQKNERAYADLYDKYADKLLGFAMCFLKNQTDAEDLIHDVFIEIWDKSVTYDHERGTVISWLMLKVRSRCLDRFRQLKALQKNTQKFILDEYSNEDSEILFESNERQSRIKSALECLSEKQRVVIEMSYFKGLTCVEISQRYDIPLGTVKTRLMSAVNLLRDNIDQQGVKI